MSQNHRNSDFFVNFLMKHWCTNLPCKFHGQEQFNNLETLRVSSLQAKKVRMGKITAHTKEEAFHLMNTNTAVLFSLSDIVLGKQAQNLLGSIQKPTREHTDLC